MQPVYPRAPGHRPVTNLRKALEKWNAVCYLAGGPFGSLYWAQREEICGCRAFLGRLGVCKLTFVRLRSAGIADRKVSWLPCAGSILLRRARGESRGGRRRDVGTAFWCVFDVLAQPRGRRPPSWAGLQSCAMWELSLGVVLGACSAGGCFLWAVLSYGRRLVCCVRTSSEKPTWVHLCTSDFGQEREKKDTGPSEQPRGMAPRICLAI